MLFYCVTKKIYFLLLLKSLHIKRNSISCDDIIIQLLGSKTSSLAMQDVDLASVLRLANKIHSKHWLTIQVLC